VRVRTAWGSGIVVLILLLVGGNWLAGRWRLAEFPGQCNQAVTAEDWERLEELSRDWIEREPQSGVAWFWLGKSQHARQNYTEAFESFSHVPLTGPRGIEAATLRLEIQFHVLHQPLSALKIADEILQIEPNNFDARRNRVYFYAMTMQRAELMAEIRQLIRVGGDLPEHYLYLINVDDLWFIDGAEIVQRWRDQAPESQLLKVSHLIQKAKRARGNTLDATGPAAAQAYTDVLAELDLLDEECRKFTSYLEFRMLNASDDGDVAEMGRWLSLVTDSMATDPVFWYYKGWYASRQARIDEAEESYREALRLHPLSRKARHDWSQLLRNQGDTSQAGRVAALAAQGTSIVLEVRRLPHFREAPPQMLRAIAAWATDCSDFEVAQGIHRHQNPNVR
jgi:tetratricopeptide (TPR) repeat protein